MLGTLNYAPYTFDLKLGVLAILLNFEYISSQRYKSYMRKHLRLILLIKKII